MQTTCPDCTSSFSVSQPGTDPGALSACDQCGSQVQGGAFLCPGCKTGLQVVHSLLPAEGGNGRCPDCSEIVWIPPLVASNSSAPASSGEASAADDFSEMVTGNDTPAPHVLGDEAGEEDAPQDSFLAEDASTSTEVGADFVSDARSESTSHRGLGFFLGLVVGAGAAVALIVTQTWAPPPVPWASSFSFALETTWTAAAGLVGGVLGMLLGGGKR